MIHQCCLQWQGPWLLSVDRQEVQSISDNAWNACILRQCTTLFACTIANIVGTIKKNENASVLLKKMLRLLPPMSIENGRLICQILNNTIDLEELKYFIQTCRVVPIKFSSTTKLSFASGSETVWLPHTIVNSLDEAILKSWFAQFKPFSSQLFMESDHDGGVFHPLWKVSLQQVTESYLSRHRHQFNYRYEKEESKRVEL
jgi:hypothetical protein